MLEKTHRLPNVYLPIAYGGPTPRNSDKENSSAQLKLPQAMRGNSEKYGGDETASTKGGALHFFGDSPLVFIKDQKKHLQQFSQFSVTIFGYI